MFAPALCQETSSGSIATVVKTICVAVPLCIGQTTTSMPARAVFEMSTSSGAHDFVKDGVAAEGEAPMTSQACIQEIRAVSGLTWKEIAGIFGVSLRSVHLWANGEKVSAEHETKIREVLEKLLALHNGDARTTASRLRSVQGGVPLLSRLTLLPHASIVGMGVTPARPRPKAVNQEELMANWRPVAPFRDRWESEPIEEVVPVGNYPVKRLKVATKRQG